MGVNYDCLYVFIFMAKSKNFIIMLVAFFFVLFLTMITAMLIGLPRFYSLAGNAHYSTGVVVAKEPENHMSVWFQYTVEGQIFRLAGQAKDLERPFDGIQIGETIPISYDSTNYGSAVMVEHLRSTYIQALEELDLLL